MRKQTLRTLTGAIALIALSVFINSCKKNMHASGYRHHFASGQ
jgi:hypothetical protein